MTVIVVTACPVGLRGHLTRWLLEISPGVFVGRVTTRVRTLMWQRVIEMVKNGRAIMVYNADNEQGLAFEVHEHEWIPVDFEGINLMLVQRRPHTTKVAPAAKPDGVTRANAADTATANLRVGPLLVLGTFLRPGQSQGRIPKVNVKRRYCY
jgi:CRISPR-associated protein Cas2